MTIGVEMFENVFQFMATGNQAIKRLPCLRARAPASPLRAYSAILVFHFKIIDTMYRS